MRNKLLIVICLILFSGCDPFGEHYSDIDEVIWYEAGQLTSAPESVSIVKVMTWNIKFGGGRIDFWFDCHGDRVLMTESEVLSNLQGLAEFINQFQPDILLLQEADVQSKRCAYVDQVQWLLDNTDLNFGVYASQWLNQYVPSDGIGPVDSGNAVLSRWPFQSADRIALDLRTDQDALTKMFYLKRNILKTKVDLPGTNDLWVLNIHTSAFSQDGTKHKQLDRLKAEMDALHLADEPFVAGGDFNTIPPGSVKQHDFPDSICEDEDFQADDYTEEIAEGWIEDFYVELNPESGYYPAITLMAYGTMEWMQSEFYTHTVQHPDNGGSWSRKLDYLFTNIAAWQEPLVHSWTLYLSDHAPVSGKVVVQ